MQIFFTAEQIAASKAEWEPQLRTYAESTTAALRNARRLPIYEQAVVRASEWLDDIIANRLHLLPHELLVIAGDEHVHAASTDADIPEDWIFLYQPAWKRWWSSVFLRGEAPWWQEISWSINSSERILDLTHPFDHALELTPNQTYLCTEQVADRGSHSIVTVADGQLVTVQELGKWRTL